MNAALALTIGLLTLEGLSFLFTRAILRLPGIRYLLWPGIMLHELGHYVMAKLTLAPVHEVHFGLISGHVVHGRSRVPFIGTMLIALAPIAAAWAALYGLCSWAGIGAAGLLGSPFTFTSYIYPLVSWQSALIILALINIFAACAPSGKDVQNALPGLILILIAVLAWAPAASVALSFVALFQPLVFLLAIATAVAWGMVYFFKTLEKI